MARAFFTEEQRAAFWKAFDDPGCVAHQPFALVPAQRGPLRHFDREMRCESPGCGAPTHFKLQGLPLCTIHCLREMNEMLLDAGTEA